MANRDNAGEHETNRKNGTNGRRPDIKLNLPSVPFFPFVLRSLSDFY